MKNIIYNYTVRKRNKCVQDAYDILGIFKPVTHNPHVSMGASEIFFTYCICAI
jgi:hypothetical protein